MQFLLEVSSCHAHNRLFILTMSSAQHVFSLTISSSSSVLFFLLLFAFFFSFLIPNKTPSLLNDSCVLYNSSFIYNKDKMREKSANSSKLWNHFFCLNVSHSFFLLVLFSIYFFIGSCSSTVPESSS